MSEPVVYDEQTRSIANRILERLQQDETFREQLKADPVGSLTTNGLPDEAVADFLGAIKFQGEVAGYMRPTHDHCKCYGWEGESTCYDGRVTIP